MNPNQDRPRCRRCGSFECGIVCRFPEEAAYWYADYKIRDEKLRGPQGTPEREERGADGRLCSPTKEYRYRR